MIFTILPDTYGLPVLSPLCGMATLAYLIGLALSWCSKPTVWDGNLGI